MTANSNFDNSGPTPEKEQFSLQLSDENGMMKLRKSQKKRQDKEQNSWYYLGFVGQIGYTVALPIVGGGLLGGYIDSKLSTYPKATLLFLLLGLVVSITGFIETIKTLMRQK